MEVGSDEVSDIVAGSVRPLGLAVDGARLIIKVVMARLAEGVGFKKEMSSYATCKSRHRFLRCAT